MPSSSRGPRPAWISPSTTSGCCRALTDRIVGAARDAAGRGVTVRLAYDKTQEAEDDATLKAFGDAGGDPAPTGTHLFIARAALPPSVQVRAIVEEAIDPGHQIMHQKYIVRDASTPDAAMLIGSANFTTDAWGIQDNNVLVITEAEDLADAYSGTSPICGPLRS